MYSIKDYRFMSKEYAYEFAEKKRIEKGPEYYVTVFHDEACDEYSWFVRVEPRFIDKMKHTDEDLFS